MGARVRAGGILSAAMLCLLPAPAPRASAQQDPERLLRPLERMLDAPRAPGELLVRFREDATAEQRDAARGAVGAALKRVLRVPEGKARGPLHLIQLPPAADEAASLKRLARDPAVLYAEPNYRVFKADTLPDDPRFGQLWGLRNTGQAGGTPGGDIAAAAAWDLTTGSASVVVAVLDTGVDYTHPDLQPNLWVNTGETAGNGVDDDANGFVDDIHGWDFFGNGTAQVPHDADPMDVDGHGTHVAGTIGAAGNNGTGVTGVAWTVRIMALRFLGPDGGFVSDAVAAYGYVATLKSRGVNVVAINNSWGGTQHSQSLEDAVEAAGAAGILSVCAAGNSGVNVDDVPHYPSSFDLPSVIAVGASDRRDAVPLFSNFGAEGVDLFAPGVEIVSTIPASVDSEDGTPLYDTYHGTSMAAPHVTGAAALLAAHRPGIGVAEMRARILYNVDKRDGFAGRAVTCGRLNVRRALQDDDAVAPGAVSDLSAPADRISYSAVELEWTAPGDDGASGQASAYEVRRSASPITAANFHAAIRVPCPPLPLPAGSVQTFRICGLPSAALQYFAVRVYDNVGNASAVSGAVSATTSAESAAVAVFEDAFEGGTAFDAARWPTVTGTWAQRNDGGSRRASDCASTYLADSDTWIITAPINLTGRRDATLSFLHRYDFEFGWDFGIIQVSSDGGSTWRRLAQYTSTRAYQAVDRLCLAPYDGLADVRLRFRVLTDDRNNAQGWRIDDLRVLASNRAPVADDQAVVAAEDAPAAVTLTGSDADGDPLAFSVLSGPSHGLLTGTAPNLTYAPAADYHGPDSFTFRVSDGAVNSAAATVSITVAPVNDPPAALPQAVSTPQDAAVGITLTAVDPDGQPLTYVVASAPANGLLSGTPPALTYTPDPGYAGADSFTFRAGDGIVLSAAATVSITVAPVNGAPTATAQSATTDEDTAVGITLSGDDPDGHPLTYAVAAGPAHGVLTGTAPNLTYTPAADYHGSDSFTFRVSDGTLQSGAATVSITVDPVNDPPTGSPTAVVVDQGGTLLITLVASDPDGDALSYQVTVPPQHGTLAGTGPAFVYTPSAGYTGPDSLSFTVGDGTTTSAPVVVNFTAPATVLASSSGGGGGGGGSCGLLGVETLLLLALLRPTLRRRRRTIAGH